MTATTDLPSTPSPVSDQAWDLPICTQMLADFPNVMRTLDVGVDLDGVCYDFCGSLAAWVHDTTGRDLDSLPPASTWEFYASDWDMSLDDFLAHCHAAVDGGHLFRVGEPFPGVIEGIARLLAAGHRVHVITDRDSTGQPGNAAQATREWLAEHGLEHTSLTFSPDKTSVRTDVFIEDRPKNFLALRAAGVDAFLRDHPYNRDTETPEGRRVGSFAEFVDAVLERATDTSATPVTAN